MTSIFETFQAAVEHHRQGRFARAEVLYQDVLRIDPSHADALHLRGVTAFQQKNYVAAVESIERAIAENGACAAFHQNLAAAYRALGNFDQAVESLRAAVELQPTSTEIHFALGMLLSQRGQLQEAGKSLKQALKIDGRYADAWVELGNVLQKLGRFDGAVESYRRALQLSPADDGTLSNLASAYRELERFEEAVQCFKKSIELNPNAAATHYNLGLVFKDQDATDEAIECYQRSLSLEPNDAEVHNNLGVAYHDQLRCDVAHHHLSQALTLRPEYADAQFNCSLIWLQRGDWKAGWEAYEWRLARDASDPLSEIPRWNGSQCEGQSILVTAEQGVGDQILFASCIPELQSITPRLTVACEPRLVPLFQRSFPKTTIIGSQSLRDISIENYRDAYDLQIPLGSLPRIFRPTFEAFPHHAGYLTPESQTQKRWQQRYESLGPGLKVGVSWRGGKTRNIQIRRSTELEAWVDVLSVPGVHFVNLQYGDCEHELAGCRLHTGVTIHDWSDANPLADLDGFAAQVSALDVVISIDNATVHMAGALGVPTWTLLPYASDWRWLLNREDSPWYPGMRLFRQKQAGRWGDVFTRVTRNLQHRAAEL